MEGKKTLSLLSLIFAIVGIVLTFANMGIGALSIAALVLVILGFIFSFVGKSKEGKSGLTTAGFVISLIGIILWVIIIVIVGIFVAGTAALLGMF